MILISVSRAGRNASKLSALMTASSDNDSAIGRSLSAVLILFSARNFGNNF